jgi:hypothetical protein
MKIKRFLTKAEQAIIVIALDRLEASQPFVVPTATRLANEMRSATIDICLSEE